LISIIIPAYNEGEAIVGQLKSLFEVNKVDQCVVVDASDKGAFEVIRDQVSGISFGGTLSYIAAETKGRGAQMNIGAANSEGSTLLFLHADTQLPAGALQQIREGINAGWHWGHFDVCFDQPAWPFNMIASMMNWRSRKTGITTGDQAMFVTRAAYDLVGGFDEIDLMEDIAMSKKLKTIGVPLCLDMTVQTASRRWQEKGVFRTVLLMWWLRLAYWLGVSPARLAQWYR
jgi:rSAM/selenodomain-associated transferase 2